MMIEYDLGLGIVDQMGALRRYARILTRTPEHAEDLVQDCIERALGRPHLYRPGTNLRAWLFTMLRNIAITQGRRAKHVRVYAAERLATGSSISAPNQLHFVALREHLRLTQSLSPIERQAVALRGIFDMSYEEAARHSGVKVGTLKSRLIRGRARLRSLGESAKQAA